MFACMVYKSMLYKNNLQAQSTLPIVRRSMASDVLTYSTGTAYLWKALDCAFSNGPFFEENGLQWYKN